MPSSEPAYQVIRCNGTVTPFDSSKIDVAVTKAFLAVEGNSTAASRRVHEIVAELTDQTVANLTRCADTGRTFHIETVQDQIELPATPRPAGTVIGADNCFIPAAV